jgi:hypothetical protein
MTNVKDQISNKIKMAKLKCQINPPSLPFRKGGMGGFDGYFPRGPRFKCQTNFMPLNLTLTCLPQAGVLAFELNLICKDITCL